MSNWTERDLRQQYNRAKANGWIPWFAEAGDSVPDDEIDAADLMAIASRETNMKNIKGDFRDGRYHGYSLMQLDIGSHPEWIASGAWRDAHKAIHKGADALDDKLQEVISGRGERLKAKAGAFTGKDFTPEQLRLIAFAAYNSGLNAYYSFSVDGDADKRTTGKNYGRDVDRRSVYFRKWLDVDGHLGNGADEPTPEPVAVAPVVVAAAVTPVVAVEGGAKADDPVKANNQGLIAKVTGWAAGSLSLGVVMDGITRVTGLSPTAQIILVTAVVLFGIVGAVIAWRDHAQTKELRASPDKLNVK